MAPIPKFLTLALILAGLCPEPGFSAPPEILFQSGFEPDSRIVPLSAQFDDIIGIDHAFKYRNDWQKDLEQNPKVGAFRIQYESGTVSDRFARIIPDPDNNANHVLHFWLKHAAIPQKYFDKGRIQAQIYGLNPPQPFKELFYKVRLKLHEDMQTLESYPNKIPWLTLMEFWNDPVGSPFPFRISLGLIKAANQDSKQPLHFQASAQNYVDGKFADIWQYNAPQYSLTYGTWISLELYYKQGNQDNGQMRFILTTEDGRRQTLFDINNWTHNTHNSKPRGLTNFHPMKLYTSDALIDHVRWNGGVMQIFWDDFELWSEWPNH